MSTRNLFQPLRNPSFIKYFMVSIPLLAGFLLIFIDPGKLDASDFMLIAWNPAQELLRTGSIYANYPYPLWTVVVMLPFTLWPAKTAMVLWLICNLLMLAASLSLFISLIDREVSPVLFALAVFLSAYFLPVLTSFWIGQLTIFSLFILALTTYLYLHQRWTWLGIVLGLSFIKPQVMILLAGLLLLWALWHRRWQIWIGFSALILILVLISIPFMSSPGQIFGGGISDHLTTYVQKSSTIWGLFLSLGIPWFFPLLISFILSIWLVWIWLPVFRGKEISINQVFFLFSAAILINLIVIPYSWMHNLTLLLLPFGYSLHLALKVKHRVRFVWLTFLLVLMGPFTLGLFMAFDRTNNTQAYQIIPALILLPTMVYLELRIPHQLP